MLASLGADGAVLVDDDGAIHGQTPVVPPLSSVGAGDAMLAGFLAGGGAGAEALAEALAWGAAAVLQPGSGMPSPDDIDLAAVRLERHETDAPGPARHAALTVRSADRGTRSRRRNVTTEGRGIQ